MPDLASIDYLVSPGGILNGDIRVPGDKSISHRALMLGAIAKGETRVDGFLQGEDTLATLAAFQSMGVEIQRNNDCLTIQGVGLLGLQPPAAALDLGNSGTSARMMAGLLAGQAFDSSITGDASLRQRPMQRIIEPLLKMGAVISAGPQGKLPLQIRGGRKLSGINYTLPVASAQLKSCLLLAGLYADGKTCINEPVLTRDHTERMLEAFAVKLERQDRQICVTGGTTLTATRVFVPADLSSAAFFLVGASIAEGSDITLTRVGINPTRNAVIEILCQMGADISLNNVGEVSGEPLADIHVRSSALKGIDIPENKVAIAIDEIPAILVAAACARGVTRVRGAAELRVKESDRIAAMASGLRALGIVVTTKDDGIDVTGGRLTGGTVESFGDHRIAMAFAMAGLRASGPVRIRDCGNVDTSFPGFPDLAAEGGLLIEVSTDD